MSNVLMNGVMKNGIKWKEIVDEEDFESFGLTPAREILTDKGPLRILGVRGTSYFSCDYLAVDESGDFFTGYCHW